MAYIGRQNLGGAYRQLDDISSSFNGSTTAFTMQVNSTNISLGDVNQIVLSLGGVVQKPGTDFTISGSTLTFTTAPAESTSFFAILLGSDNGGTVTPTDSSVTSSKLSGNIDAPGTLSTTLSNSTQTTPGLTINNTVTGGFGAALAFDVHRSDSGNQATAARIYPSRADVWSSDAASDADLNFQVSQDGTVATRMTVSGTGDVSIADGNLTVANGHGIDFSATSDGTTMSSELLDDYEEGDWTIGLSTSSGAMTMNSTYQYGKYTKIGNMVTITGYAVGSAIGSATSSQGLTMTGLPFAIIGENGAYSGLSVGYAEGMSLPSAAQYSSVGGYARINYSTVPLRLWDTTSGGSALLQSEFGNTGGIIFMLSYFVS